MFGNLDDYELQRQELERKEYLLYKQQIDNNLQKAEDAVFTINNARLRDIYSEILARYKKSILDDCIYAPEIFSHATKTIRVALETAKVAINSNTNLNATMPDILKQHTTKIDFEHMMEAHIELEKAVYDNWMHCTYGLAVIGLLSVTAGVLLATSTVLWPASPVLFILSILFIAPSGWGLINKLGLNKNFSPSFSVMLDIQRALGHEPQPKMTRYCCGIFTVLEGPKTIAPTASSKPKLN